MSVGGLMFGSRHGEVHTLATMRKELTAQDVYISKIRDDLRLEIYRTNALERRLYLLMDYLGVDIESGDRIVPKDNAQG